MNEIMAGGVEEDPLRAQADGDQVQPEERDSQRIRAIATDQVRREWHEREGEEEAEVAPGQSFAVAAHAAEDSVVHHPELSDDDERDQVARQLGTVQAERVPQCPRGIGVCLQRTSDRYLQLQNQQRQGNGDDAIGQCEQAIDTWNVLVFVLGLVLGLVLAFGFH